MQSIRKFFAPEILTGALETSVVPKVEERKYVIHQVFFWLNDSKSKSDLNKLLNGLKTLEKIEVVKKIHIGIPAATEKRDVVDNSFDASEILFFESSADQKKYQDHPVHRKFVEECSHLWKKVVVYDAEEV